MIKPFAKFLWAFFVFFALFAASEILLHAFWRPSVDTRAAFLIRHHPLWGWEKTPHARAMHQNDQYTVFEPYNSKGLRGPEYAYEKKPGERRILVLGDSHAEGHSVKFEDLFSEFLKRELNQSGRGFYEVINTGTGGYSTDQELLYFQHEAKKYRPDIAILTFSLNNVVYNSLSLIASWHKPLFVLEKGELRLTRVPVPKPETYSKIRKFFKTHCYTTQFLYHQLRHTPFYFFISRWGLTPFQNQFRVWQRKETPQVRAAWELTEALLVKLQQEVQASGSRFVVFYVPVAASVYPEAWRQKQEKYGWSDAEWDPLQDGRKLETICKKHGIDFLNPVERFRQAAARPGGDKLYSIEEEHWIPEGHRMAGDILYEYLVKKGWV